MNELLIEVVLRGGKVILAGLLGMCGYVFLVAPLGPAAGPLHP